MTTETAVETVATETTKNILQRGFEKGAEVVAKYPAGSAVVGTLVVVGALAGSWKLIKGRNKAKA